MCGIVGVKRSWRSDRRAVEAALRALEWRGPDGSRAVDAGDWTLGVARLVITDPAAAQPIVCGRTGRAVAFNGAVTSAARDWSEFGGLATTRNDAELLLLRHAARGPAALGDACGPFAFALVDPHARALWLGRDPEGEKPLYAVLEQGSLVAFASSAASLWRLGVAIDLDDEVRARVLRFGFGPAPAKVPGPIEVRAAWHGVWGQAGDGPWRALATDAPRAVADSAGAGLADTLRAAVERCARAEVGAGVCVSGGVDSAAVAACLHELGSRLPAYQFRADGADAAERDLAREVAARCGLELREVGGGPELLHALPALTRSAGRPLADPSLLAAHAIGRTAARDGVRVLLSGEGADDLLLGYPRHRAARWLPRRGVAWLPAPGLGTGRAARLLRALAAERPYEALLEVAPPAFRAAVYTPPFRDGHLACAGGVPPDARARDPLEDARRTDREQYLRDDLLPKLDTALMAAGVEGRCPFLDPAVVASAAVREPDARAVLGKRALRRAFAGRVPARVLAARKRGLGVPLDRWIATDDFVPDLLSAKRTLERPHVCRAGLLRMLDLQRSGRARLGHALYALAAVECFDRAREEALA